MGWLIFGGIALALILLFTRSVTVLVDYGERLDVKIKYLFFTLYPTKLKKKNARKKKKKPSEAPKKEAEGRSEADAAAEDGEAPADGTHEASSGNTDFSEKPEKRAKKKKEKGGGLSLETIIEYIKSASPPVKRLFKKIRVRDLSLHYVVGTDDAAKTAIQYGSVCAAVYPLVEFLKTFFSVRTREIRVEADFLSSENRISAHGKIMLRVSTALGCILWLGVRVMKTYLKNLKKQEA